MAFVVSLLITFSALLVHGQDKRKAQDFPYLVQGDVDVYARPGTSDWPVVTLGVGDTVRVLPGEWDGYKKIAFVFKGRTRVGYMPKRQLENLSKSPRLKKSEASQRWGYLSLVGSYQQQGERDLQTSADSIYEVSEFVGTSFFFGTGLDFALSAEWEVRVGMNMRTVQVRGDARADGAMASQEFDLTYKFMGAEIGVRHYFVDQSRWSLMGTFEIIKAMSADLKVVDGPELAVTDIELPTFFVLTGGLHYDWRLNEKWAIESGARLGAIANAEPAILLAEGLVQAKYAW